MLSTRSITLHFQGEEVTVDYWFRPGEPEYWPDTPAADDEIEIYEVWQNEGGRGILLDINFVDLPKLQEAIIKRIHDERE